MLVELGLVEQRHKAILEVLGGASVSDVAESGAVLLATDGGVGGEVATPNAPRSSLEEPEGSD